MRTLLITKMLLACRTELNLKYGDEPGDVMSSDAGMVDVAQAKCHPATHPGRAMGPIPYVVIAYIVMAQYPM